MAKTKDFGRLYFQFGYIHSNLKRKPFFGVLPSVQIDPPYKQGRAFFLRLPFIGWGMLIGLWEKVSSFVDEESALMQAVHGWGVNITGSLADSDVRDTVRKIVAQNAEDLDDEWQVMQALGLDSPDQEIFCAESMLDDFWDEDWDDEDDEWDDEVED